MSCESESLFVRYNERWNYHIFEVVIVRDGVQDVYHWNYLKHEQRKTVCGNDVRFHRYFAGINIEMEHLKNYNVSGLFNDSRCLSNP